MDISAIKWPDVLTIQTEVREFKKRMLALLRDDEDVQDQKVRDLNYVVAVSSGKAVTEEIPKQIGRRAGWASQQGANFVELAIENPAQLIMDQDMLINLSHHLNLHYNIHSSTNFAYGMAYRQAQGRGFDPVHEYSVKLLTEIERFRTTLRAQGLDPAEDGLPRLYSINPHMAVSQLPAEEDRLAQDVSVDPFGEEMRYSQIFENPETRLGIWKYYFWEYQNMKDDPNSFAQILSIIESLDDHGDYVRRNLIDILEREGYISNQLLDFTKKLIRVERGQIAQSFFDISPMGISDLPDTLGELKNHQNGLNYAYSLAQLDPRQGWERFIESQTRGIEQSPRFEGSSEQARELAIEQAQETFGEMGLSVPGDIPDKHVLDLTQDHWRQMQEEANYATLDRDGEAFQDVTDFFGSSDEEYDEDHKKPSEVMRRLAGSRRLFQEEFNKESTIFRRLMPLWMPFAAEQGYGTVQQMWEGITGKSFKNHEDAITWLYHGSDAAMNDPRQEEDVIAAATGAYVWGHFTQIPPGYDQTLVQLLEDVEMFMTFEAHFAGPAENTRIWKPKDMIEVVKAINNTDVVFYERQEDGNYRPVDEKTTNQCRITIDMEHLATQKVDPMWVIDPDNTGKKRGYKGLEDGDGKYILMQHVTHPYITESGPGHDHGPIQRGDTLVYKYIYKLVEKGMAMDETYPAVFMYELGAEKTETMYLMRLLLRMIEYGIEPHELTNEGGVTTILNKDQPENLKEYLIQKYFGVTDTEFQHEWQEIFEHALDPLEDLIEVEGHHGWMGQAAIQNRGVRPEEWQKEEHQ